MIRDAKGLEVYLRELLDTLPDASFMVDPAGRLALVNGLMEGMFGYESGELRGKSVGTLIPERFRHPHAGHCADYFAHPRPRAMGVGLDLRALRKNGAEFPVEISLNPVETDEGTFVLGAIRDINQSEERYRAIFEQVLVGVVHSNTDGKILNVNRKFCEISGYTRDEALALDIRHLMHADDVGKSVDARARMLEGAMPAYEREVRQIRKGGTGIWTHVTTSPVRGVDGRPVHFISLVHDISERKRYEHELLAAQRQLQATLDAVPDLLFELGLGGHYYDVHSPRTDLMAAAPGSMIGRTVSEILPVDAAATVLAALREANEKGHAAGQQFELALPHGRFWFELSVARKAGVPGEEPRFICLSRDITQRKQAEIRVVRLNRVHALLSGINALIVRVATRDELFKQACRIAVEAGGFRLAWIGVVNRQAGRIDLAAVQGADERYLQTMPLGLDDAGLGLAGLTVRERRAQVVDDMATDPRILLKEESLQRGFHSLVTLPLMVSDKVMGVLALYAQEVGFFDAEEMKLLDELAGDISFALDHLEKAGRLDYLAFYDALTGMANRSLFSEHLTQILHAAGQAGEKAALVLVDIDRLRTVNESLGRNRGDALLKQVAERLGRVAGGTETGRIGADQFALVLPRVKGRSEAGRMGQALVHRCFAEPFVLGDTALRVTASTGTALYPSDGGDAETLLKHAEAALRKGKESGERYAFYTPDLTERIAATLTLENRLRQALENGELVLHYQPKVELDTRRITGVEGLIRWQSPELGLVPPAKFIPLMEETGMILEAGAWALSRAATDHLHWLQAGLQAPRVAVNVSAVQLRKRDFVRTLEAAIGRGAAPPGIDLEITESLAMEDIEGNILKLQELRALGIEIAIDDFGTGYSSLGYLAKLPVQSLKIDRSFIITMLKDPDNMTLVQTMISLAHSLRLKVIAEGVDAEEQAKVLRLLRCDEMQGHLISTPVSFDQMTALLARRPGET
jgi:PAS domain S-box-containing protein/diguanylate cyclase (GGDEF)-like protein